MNDRCVDTGFVGKFKKLGYNEASPIFTFIPSNDFLSNAHLRLEEDSYNLCPTDSDNNVSQTYDWKELRPTPISYHSIAYVCGIRKRDTMNILKETFS